MPNPASAGSACAVALGVALALLAAPLPAAGQRLIVSFSVPSGPPVGTFSVITQSIDLGTGLAEFHRVVAVRAGFGSHDALGSEVATSLAIGVEGHGLRRQVDAVGTFLDGVFEDTPSSGGSGTTGGGSGTTTPPGGTPTDGFSTLGVPGPQPAARPV